MGVKKAKRAAREQLAAAQLMTAELEAALDRLEGLESSVLSGGASVAAAEAGLVAGVAGFEAQVEHASTNIDDRVDAVSAGAARDDDGRGRVGTRARTRRRSTRRPRSSHHGPVARRRSFVPSGE